MWNDVSRICLKACSLAATCFAMLSQISVNLHCQLNYSYKDWCAHLWRFRTVFVLPKTWLTADKLHGAVASPTSLECLGISTEGWCGDIDGIIRSSFQPKELNTEALDINNCMLRAELTQKFLQTNYSVFKWETASVRKSFVCWLLQMHAMGFKWPNYGQVVFEGRGHQNMLAFYISANMWEWQTASWVMFKPENTGF